MKPITLTNLLRLLLELARCTAGNLAELACEIVAVFKTALEGRLGHAYIPVSKQFHNRVLRLREEEGVPGRDFINFTFREVPPMLVDYSSNPDIAAECLDRRPGGPANESAAYTAVKHMAQLHKVRHARISRRGFCSRPQGTNWNPSNHRSGLYLYSPGPVHVGHFSLRCNGPCELRR